jgi:serine/threonine protein kinase
MAAEFRKTVLGLVEKGLEERGIRKKVGVLGMKYGEGGIGKVFTCLLGKGSVAVKLVKAGPSFNPSGPMEDPDLQQRLVEATSESDHLVRYHGSMRLGTSGYRRLDIMEDLPNFNPLDNGKYGVGGWGEVSRADMPDFVRRILLPVLEGVQALHRKGIVHCDLKPMNILVKPSDHQGGDPEVKVGDYDIHKTNESTEANSFGTPPFMSPEQWMVKKITTKSDIYSIGLMLYYWAGGDRPIVNDVMDYADRAISGDHELNRLDCDPGLRAIIADCLRKNPVERPSIQELMDRIGQCFPRDSEAGRGMGVEGDPQAGKEGRDVGSDAGKVAA